MKYSVLVLFLLAVVNMQYVSQGMNLQPNDNRVCIQLYFETLCPYCKSFMMGQLKSVLEIPNIWQIANFKLIPYGNADSKKQGHVYSFTCQHGESECQGNILMNCALNLADIQTKAIPFIMCLQNSSMNWDVDGQNCANANGINFQELKSCTNSLYGRHWYYQAGLETEIINVDHVPYVTINGVFNATIQRQILQNLLPFICQNYRGTYNLPACSGIARTAAPAQNLNTNQNNQALVNSLYSLLQGYQGYPTPTYYGGY